MRARVNLLTKCIGTVICHQLTSSTFTFFKPCLTTTYLHDCVLQLTRKSSSSCRIHRDHEDDRGNSVTRRGHLNASALPVAVAPAVYISYNGFFFHIAAVLTERQIPPIKTMNSLCNHRKLASFHQQTNTTSVTVTSSHSSAAAQRTKAVSE